MAEATPRLQPCQIVCLEHDTSCLYAEVVQIIEPRQLCWARPLMLIPAEPLMHETESLGSLDYYDLRQDSDLLLPLTLFRVALDTEVFSWLARLYADERVLDDIAQPHVSGHKLLRQLIQNVCQVHPDAFQNPSGVSKS